MKLRPFRLERYFARHEFTAPYILCASDCESMPLGDLLALEEGAAERFSSLRLSYTEAAGAPELRRGIAATYERVSPDQVLVHAGAEEAIFNFMNVALEPGDGVIVHSPYYQSLGEVARAVGAEVVEWRGVPERGWELCMDTLKGLLTDRTRLVIVNFPHNPTAFLPRSSFLRDLSALSERHGFVVFSDEVYRGLEIEPSDRLPAFADLNARGVSLGVMSKSYGLAGLRIGWIATRNEALLRELAAFKDYTTICASAPSEFLAALALRHRDTIIDRNVSIVRENLDTLDAFFDRHADRFRWRRPQAGPVAFPELRDEPVGRFCERLLQQRGVLLLPGNLYGPGYNSFRIGFGRRGFSEGLARMEGFMAD